MRRQRGTIVPKGTGKWLVRFSAGQDALGKRQYPSKLVHGERADARKALSAMLADHDRGVRVQPGKLTLTAWLESWLQGSVKNRVSAKTFRDYGKLLRNHVLPAFGSKRLDAVAAKDIRQLYQAMAEEGYGRTIEYTASTLRQALQAAVSDHHLTWNPAAGIRLPKKVRPKLVVFTAEEAQAFLAAAATHPLRALWEVLLTTGLRPSEALALKWGDLDLDRTTPWLRVRRALVEEADGSFSVGEPKTASSRRTVTLPARTVAALQAHRVKQVTEILERGEAYEREDFVFANTAGRPLDLSKARAAFKRLLKGSGLPPNKLYSLRHTCATLLLEEGEDLTSVSDRLGHSTIVQTANTYAQVTPKMRQNSAETLERLFSVRK